MKNGNSKKCLGGTLVSKNVSCKKGYKYFINYKIMKMLYHCVLCFHMSAHTRHSDETKCMSFLIDDELLEK